MHWISLLLSEIWYFYIQLEKGRVNIYIQIKYTPIWKRTQQTFRDNLKFMLKTIGKGIDFSVIITFDLSLVS